MAKTLKSFETFHKGYPWDRWTNGETWEVEHKKDFKVAPDMFRFTLYSKAVRISKTTRVKHKVRVSLKGSTVRFQFYKPTGGKAKPASR